MDEYEKENGFALSMHCNPRSKLKQVLKNASGNLLKNIVKLRDQEKQLNSDALVFSKVKGNIVKIGDNKSKLQYDFKNKVLSLTTSKTHNKLFGFDFSKKPTLHVYDHDSESIFYKINKHRDTFYLSRTPDLKKLVRIGGCDVNNNSESTKKKGPEPTEFAFKPIFNKDELKKKPKISLSDELRKALKKMGGGKKITMALLTKVRVAEFNKQVKSLSANEVKILAQKNKLESNLLTELHTKIATYISIQESFKYYLVEVKTNGENRTSSKLSYVEDNIRGGYDFIVLKKGSKEAKGKKHLKVWVKE